MAAIPGEAFAVLTALCFAGANLCIARGAVRKSGDNGALLATVTTVLAAGLLWGLGGATLPGSGASLVWFVLAGLVGVVLARIMIYRSIREVGVSASAILNRLNPFFALLLGVPFLGVALGSGDLLGIALLGLAIALLFRQRAHGSHPLSAYRFGIVAAAGYGAANVLRKLGLEALPDAALGAFVAALAGLAFYLLAAPFSADYRRAFAALLAPNPWQLAAAGFVAAAQVGMFLSLATGAFEAVVMILSLELFVSMILSAHVLGLEPPLRAPSWIAAVCAASGAVLVAITP